MAAVDPTNIEVRQLCAEFDAKLAEINRRHAEARKLDAEAFKLGREGRFYPFVVFGAGSVFTLLVSAVLIALLRWGGVAS